MIRRYSKQFKEDAVHYYRSHKELGAKRCAKNIGIGQSTLSKWIREFRDNRKIVVYCSEIYSSDEQNEIERLKCELRNKKDDIDVLKKAIVILGK